MNDSSRHNFIPIQNPYIVGNPIKDQNMFFGREDDFAYTKSKIIGGKRGGLLVLCGARRSGKTSILFQIKGGRLGDEFVPVLIDMQSMTVQSDEDFLARLAREIIAGLDTPTIDYENDYSSIAAANAFGAFEDLIKKINEHLAGRKLILMFDEYEIIEGLIEKGSITQNILHILSNWMEHKEGVFIIFTGSDRLQARDPKCWERFLGRALHRRISFLSSSDTLRLVNEPVRGLVQYDPAVPELIYDLTAGQPFYTQVLCQSIVDHLNEDKKVDVDREDVHQVVQEIIENPLPQMIFAWSSLTSMEKLSLSVIAELTKDGIREKTSADIIAFPDSEKIGYRLDPNKVNESLERLFHYDLLDKDASGGTYIFKMDLWRQWITRMHSIWQVIDEIQGEGESLGEGILRTQQGRSKTRLAGLGALAVFAVAFILVYLFILRGSPQERSGIVPQFAVRDSTLLSINTVPPVAMVFLDEFRIGPTPVVKRPVAAGMAVLRIEKDGYRIVEDSLHLEKNVPFEQIVTLEELTGTLIVSSSPSEAAIVLDGEETGFVTPHTFEGLSVNELHSVRVSRQGYNEGVRDNIKIYPDSTGTCHHTFSTRKHPLIVRSEPSSARVFIDDREYDPTPNPIPQLSEGTHTLVLRKTGYLDHRQQIEIPQPANEISITLQQAPPGTVEFQIFPRADLWINDEEFKKGAINETIDLPPGAYRITLILANHRTIEDVIQIESNRTIIKKYDMQKTEK